MRHATRQATQRPDLALPALFGNKRLSDRAVCCDILTFAARWRAGREQEQALVDATLARDARTASRILRTHIDDSAAMILLQLQDRL